MPKYPFPENLTREQSDAVERAAVLILKARKEAREMLAAAGIRPDDWGEGVSTQCHAVEDGVDCPCQNFDNGGVAGGTCLTVFSTDPNVSPPHRSCGHPASKHAFGGG